MLSSVLDILPSLTPSKGASSSSPQKIFAKLLAEDLVPEEIDSLLGALTEKKRLHESEEKKVDTELLYLFLRRSYERKVEQLSQISKDLDQVNMDLTAVKADLTDIEPQEPTKGQGGTKNSPMFLGRRNRIFEHFDELEGFYFDKNAGTAGSSTQNEKSNLTLGALKSTMSSFLKYTAMTPIVSVRFGDAFNQSNIVSAIEFDRDEELFATAGVTKRIKIFSFRSVLEDAETVDVHLPVKEMVCDAKISCMSWNTYLRSHLLASDYDGMIKLWDVEQQSVINSFDDHQKRVWSVDFSPADPRRFASGADDCAIKLWDINQRNATYTIDSKANVCCVQFPNSDTSKLAVGSAQHSVTLYDLRNPRAPLRVFKGHKKAVSYVRFLDSEHIISASTDSSIRLWNTTTFQCERTFRGHLNERNFVGLSYRDDMIVSGSENNTIYVYHQAFSRPVLSYGLNRGTGRGSDSSGFVSSVLWKKNPNVIVAANSEGDVHLLRIE